VIAAPDEPRAHWVVSERGVKRPRLADAAQPRLTEPRGDQANATAVVAALRAPFGDAGPPAQAHIAQLNHSLLDLSLLDQVGAGALKASQLSRVTVQLHPPDLGSVAVAVESRDGRLCAHFHSAHPFVQTWIESNAPALRSHLAGAGVTLHDITVSTSAQEHGADGRQFSGGEEAAPRDVEQRAATYHTARPNTIGDNAIDWLA